jgi:hypothetical protein
MTEDYSMNIPRLIRRHAATTLLIAGLTAGCAQATSIESPYVKAQLVQVDVYDRADGQALPVYAKNGRHYIVGTPGHEYAVRIRNCTGGRILAVTSVDGVNVISGDNAAPSQSGYVLDPWGSVEIAGWRKSMDRTAAFYFTDLADSYAARTGRPQNVGVVGIAVYQEKANALLEREARRFDSRGSAAAEAPAESDAARPSARQSPPARTADSFNADKKALGLLGTGHGRNEESQAMTVAFERSSDSPVEIVSIQYDRRENLVAMHILPRPYVARDPRPDPFPAALRFVPDP